ncbi:hypothetical protein GF373_10880, partial [bacterium]|nr:hypothetical protein [bacterium]
SVLGVEDEGQINEKEEKNLFRTLSNLEEGLRNDETEIIKDALSDLDLDMDVILNDRTKLGARLNRVEAETNRLQENEDFSRQELSYLEDADFAELVTDLSLAETALNASLTAGARVMQQTLLDFLR